MSDANHFRMTRKSLRWSAMVLFVVSCTGSPTADDDQVDPAIPGEIQYVNTEDDPSIVPLDPTVLHREADLNEGFTGAAKPDFAAGAVTLASGDWYLEDAAIGPRSDDAQTDASSVRITNAGILQMEF